MKYKVLWIDDQCKKYPDFIDNARLDDIEIISKTTFKEGIDEFKNNILMWDGVVLDAYGWKSSEDKTPNVGGLTYALGEIRRLGCRREVPCYVYTGQAGLMDDERFSSLMSGFGVEIFYKGNTDEQLIKRIIKKADELDDHNIKIKYPIITECESTFYNDLLSLAQIVEANDYNNSEALHTVRNTIDDLMDKCNKNGLLLIKFTKTNLSECGHFLCLPPMEKYIPNYIQQCILHCIAIANPGSHKQSETEQDIINGKSTFLIKGTIFDLFCIIEWWNSYISKKIKKNDIIKTMTGIVEHDETSLKKFHCGTDFHLNVNKDFTALEGKRIIITNCTLNTDDATKNKYKYYISSFKEYDESNSAN